VTSKPFLKWPGGKYRLSERIRETLIPASRLIEPFVGSGAVFLNTHYKRYLLSDSNPDLIHLYQNLHDERDLFIDYCRSFFDPAYNREECYYAFRALFNISTDIRLKSALFIYLNRHCYNGLCRYNASGEFNTPFGRYKKPNFPEKEMRGFLQRSGRARFMLADFREIMRKAKPGDAVYCDPPYTPLSKTASFTDYSAGGFGWTEQVELADLARKTAKKGIQVVISNHDTKEIRNLYSNARLDAFPVQRNISRDGKNRGKANELLATFS